jgi:hypothetical protein
LTAAASLATNTRKMARRGWGEPRHLGQRSKGPDLGLARQVRVSRCTGVCGDAAAGALKDEANKGKNKRGARVGEGGGSCKRLPNTAQRPASHGSERGGARVFGLIIAHKAGARPWLDGQAPQRKGERGAHQWSKGTQW